MPKVGFFQVPKNSVTLGLISFGLRYLGFDFIWPLRSRYWTRLRLYYLEYDEERKRKRWIMLILLFFLVFLLLPGFFLFWAVGTLSSWVDNYWFLVFSSFFWLFCQLGICIKGFMRFGFQKMTKIQVDWGRIRWKLDIFK